MLTFFFKIKRRINFLIDRWRIWFKLLEYRSLYKGRFNVARPIHVGKDFKVFFDNSNSQIQISEEVVFRDYCQLRTGLNGKLTIGHNNFFNNHCSIQCFSAIQIGNNCQFGEATRMYDMNHHYKEPGKLISEQGYNVGKIIIGDNCWFGSNVTVLKNVTIGDNVVIGANCLVHQSIPSNSLVMQEHALMIKPIN